MIVSFQELLPLIRFVLRSGQAVRLTVKGNSMIPFIFHGDEIVLKPPQNIGIGSIVLFEYPEKVFALHRIVKTKCNSFWIRGDSQMYAVGPVRFKDVIGVVSAIHHHKNIRIPNNFFWFCAGCIWIATFPIGVVLCRLCIRFKQWVVNVLKQVNK